MNDYIAAINSTDIEAMITQAADLYRTATPYLHTASGVISALLFAVIVYAAIRSGFVRNKLEPLTDLVGIDEFSQRKAVKGWNQIERRLAEGGEANLRLAIIEADKILDTILKLSGFKGKTLGERLEQITQAQISNIEDIWKIHKIRNRIVHEPDYHINRDDTEQGIRAYKSALSQLGLLDEEG
ncbi:MAG: hypothetical protein HYS43_00800 [Candidatus Liptonbacteria bacterium]|nr:hypothetical protein [Candidatus Liptonbacteria bacterium]